MYSLLHTDGSESEKDGVLQVFIHVLGVADLAESMSRSQVMRCYMVASKYYCRNGLERLWNVYGDLKSHVRCSRK